MREVISEGAAQLGDLARGLDGANLQHRLEAVDEARLGQPLGEFGVDRVRHAAHLDADGGLGEAVILDRLDAALDVGDRGRRFQKHRFEPFAGCIAGPPGAADILDPAFLTHARDVVVEGHEKRLRRIGGHAGEKQVVPAVVLFLHLEPERPIPGPMMGEPVRQVADVGARGRQQQINAVALHERAQPRRIEDRCGLSHQALCRRCRRGQFSNISAERYSRSAPFRIRPRSFTAESGSFSSGE